MPFQFREFAAAPEFDGVHKLDKAIIWNGHTEIKNDGRGALMLLEVKRGERLKEGDVFAIKYDPTTGDELARYYAPVEGTVLNTGLVWPHCPPGQFLGVLGDVMEEVDLTTHEAGGITQ